MDRSEYIRQNVEQFHNNTVASRYQQSGLTDQSAKLNNAGFNKLMDSRGISQEARSELKNSFHPIAEWKFVMLMQENVLLQRMA